MRAPGQTLHHGPRAICAKRAKYVEISRQSCKEGKKKGEKVPPSLGTSFGTQQQINRAVEEAIVAYLFVDVERGVRRNGKLIASDIQRHIDTLRTIAQHAHLSETCLELIVKAERVLPKMQATVEFVSGYVRQQVRQLHLTPPVSYAMHAHLIPS